VRPKSEKFAVVASPESPGKRRTPGYGEEF
jgi:hypothetical protein